MLFISPHWPARRPAQHDRDGDRSSDSAVVAILNLKDWTDASPKSGAIGTATTKKFNNK